MLITQPTLLKDIAPTDLRKGMVLQKMGDQFTLLNIYVPFTVITGSSGSSVTDGDWLGSLPTVNTITGPRTHGYIIKFVDFSNGSTVRYGENAIIYPSIFIYIGVDNIGLYVHPKNIWGIFGTQILGHNMEILNILDIDNTNYKIHAKFIKCVYNSKITWPVKEYNGPVYIWR